MPEQKENKKWRILAIFLVIIIIPSVWFTFLRSDDGFKTASETLTGQWLREDGPYTLDIKSLNKDGTIEVAYFNPNPVSGIGGKWMKNGDDLFISVVLDDPSYKGSTYDLKLNGRTKKLGGIYYQAIAKQSYDVYFEKKSN